jgi:transposase InsO family protein
VRIFEQIKGDHGLPQVIRSDNGPEFLGEGFVQWLKANGVVLRYIQPGRPNQNAYIERFNRTFREEVLYQHLFARPEDVREQRTGGASTTTSNAHTPRWATRHPATTVNKPPDVLVLKCLLDGEAYVAAYRHQWSAQSEAHRDHLRNIRADVSKGRR